MLSVGLGSEFLKDVLEFIDSGAGNVLIAADSKVNGTRKGLVGTCVDLKGWNVG